MATIYRAVTEHLMTIDPGWFPHDGILTLAGRRWTQAAPRELSAVASPRDNTRAGSADAFPFARVTPAYRRGIETRRRILKAAVALFSRDGFHATTINQIAEQAGVTGPALYYHFRTKSEILAATFFQIGDDLVDAFEEVIQDESRSQPDKLRSFVGVMISHIAENREAFSLLFIEDRNLREGDLKEAQRRRRANRDRFVDLILQVRTDLDANTAHILANAATWSILSLAFIDHQEVSFTDDVLQQLHGSVMASLLP